MKTNVIKIIHPYKIGKTWVFDDAATGLVQEPFVAGMSEILDELTKRSFKASIAFSSSPFPGYDAELTWELEEHGGNWYFWEARKMRGWLCPALLLYFENPPKKIFVKILP